MTQILRLLAAAFVLIALCVLPSPVDAQGATGPIAPEKIAALDTQLAEADENASSARKKLALRRVIREAEALIEQQPEAPNRFEVLGVMFRCQRELIELEDSTANRSAFLDTCRRLAEAPNDYAAIRLDADLLLSQAELARQGADRRARADALRPLVERYRDTEVEVKVVRIALLMALEFGDVALSEHLRDVIAERFPGDIEMIKFQREKLAGQVFGAPFIGVFERPGGGEMRFPMDTLGQTTAVFFWSKDNGGVEHLKELAAVWQTKKQEAAGRLTFVSINLDELPDAGESILREQGLDWPALRLEGGRDSDVYQAYARRDPAIISVSTSGYAALFMAGGNSDTNGYERWLNSSLARNWTQPRYTGQFQSLLAGEFLILDPRGTFDPALPPELAALSSDSEKQPALATTDKSVPAETLRAIQACFIAPPMRYRTPFDEVRANYEKAEALCREAIAAHPEAPNLWVVRNRRVVALMGLWKLTADNTYLDRAAAEAQAALDAGMPAGTDTAARLCLARQALHAKEADAVAIIEAFAPLGAEQSSGPRLAAAALLAMEVGDRRLHERYRQAVIDDYIDHPMLWTASAFMLDRYHRYWLYHPPFVAGWTYGRRQGHFLAIGTPDDAERSFQAEFTTLDGQVIKLPDASGGKWTVVSFASPSPSGKDGEVRYTTGHDYLSRYGANYAATRPVEDVNLIAAVVGEDASAVQQALEARKTPYPFPTVMVPGGLSNPSVNRLGLLAEDERPNLVILRPDGGIAAVLSGLTMSAQNGNVVENVIEWHDEQAVDAALARGDLGEAKRLAFTFAPVEDPAAADPKKRPKVISVPHRRSRLKVYMAMQDWPSAMADAEEVYLEVHRKAGWLSMRTDELDEIERLKAEVERRLEGQTPAASRTP